MQSITMMDFYNACKLGNVQTVNEFLADRSFDPNGGEYNAINIASGNGQVEVLKILLGDGRIDPSQNDDEAMYNACSWGHLNIVKLLVEDGRSKPNSKMFVHSCECQHLDVVEYLIDHPNVDPGYDNNEAIRSACVRGDYTIAKFLLQNPRVNPSDGDNAPIKCAVMGSGEIVRLLLKDSRVDPTVNENQPLRVALFWCNLDSIYALLEDPRIWSSPRVQIEIHTLEAVARSYDMEMLEKLFRYGGERLLAHLPILREKYPNEMATFG